MSKWFIFLSTLFFFLSSGCFSQKKTEPAKVATTNAPRQSIAVNTTPSVFAHFEVPLQDEENAEETESSLCVKSELFVKRDVCSPKIYSTRFDANSSFQTGNSNWTLPRTPQFLVWEQVLKRNHKLTVELIDSDGLPWPTSSEVYQKKDNQYIVQLEVNYELPKSRDLFLTGSVYDEKGDKVNTWFLPLSVKKGKKSNKIWAYKPPKRKKARYRKRKRRK